MCDRRREEFLRRKRRQGQSEPEHRQQQHDPESGKYAQEPRPDESRQALPAQQAARDEKAADDEKGVHRHAAGRKIIAMGIGIPERPDADKNRAMGGEHDKGRYEADQIEMIISVFGAVSESRHIVVL